MSKQIIAIPLGTRLSALVINADSCDVWIALKQRGPDVSAYQGTFLRVYHNGKVERITRDNSYDVDDIMIVRPADE